METAHLKTLLIAASLAASLTAAPSGGAAYADPTSTSGSSQVTDRAPPPRHRSKAVITHTEPAQNCDYAEGAFDTVLTGNSFDPTAGCNARSNLDAMIGNRRDLITGRGTRYSDGERAANVVSRYRKGHPDEAKPAPGAAGKTSASKTTGE